MTQAADALRSQRAWQEHRFRTCNYDTAAAARGGPAPPHRTELTGGVMVPRLADVPPP